MANSEIEVLREEIRNLSREIQILREELESVKETLYLLSIPGMREKFLKAEGSYSRVFRGNRLVS
jgi:hypothetical protein